MKPRTIYASRLQFSPKAVSDKGRHTATKLMKWEQATAKRLRVDMLDMFALHGAGMVVCESVPTPIRDQTKWRLTPKGRSWLTGQLASAPVEPTPEPEPEPPAATILLDPATVADVARIMKMRGRLNGSISEEEDKALMRVISKWLLE